MMSFRTKAVSLLGIVAIACSVWAEDKDSHWTSSKLPIDKLPSELGERVSTIVDHPALYTHGPTEEVLCDPATYFWLLDHPDRATLAWRRLGAKCVDIQNCGDDCFSCSDPNGNDVRWSTIYRSPEMRIWYAEGSIKVGSLLKPVTGEAILVVRHTEAKDAKGRDIVRQQTDMILHADSKTATFVAKVLGASMPQLAEQYVVHEGKFFSLLAMYLRMHPEKAVSLLAEKSPEDRDEPGLAIPTSPLKARELMKSGAGQK
jgi:hypothetical protein